jgi:hypothetical protein
MNPKISPEKKDSLFPLPWRDIKSGTRAIQAKKLRFIFGNDKTTSKPDKIAGP